MDVLVRFVFLCMFYYSPAATKSSLPSIKCTGSNKTQRPCSLDDLACIRKKISPRLQCNAVEEVNSGCYVLNIRIFSAHTNSSFQLSDATATGFDNFEIKEFSINKNTNTAVLEVEFEEISVKTNYSCAYFARNGKEPYVTCDNASIIYRNMSITLTIYDKNNVNNKSIKGSNIHIFVYFNDANIPVSLGPGFVPKDPEILPAYNEIVKQVDLTIMEFFITKGPRFTQFFLNTAICDVDFKGDCEV